MIRKNKKNLDLRVIDYLFNLLILIIFKDRIYNLNIKTRKTYRDIFFILLILLNDLKICLAYFLKVIFEWKILLYIRVKKYYVAKPKKAHRAN